MAVTGTEPMAATLNKLMNGELEAAHMYFQAAAWCAQAQLPGCTRFFMHHADEEMAHMRKVLQYLIDVDLPAQFEELAEPQIDANEIEGVFHAAFAHEQLVTRRYFAAVKEAEAAGDLSTVDFLNYFVAEQREEEMLLRQLVARLDLIGEGPHKLMHIDNEVAKLAAAADH